MAQPVHYATRRWLMFGYRCGCGRNWPCPVLRAQQAYAAAVPGWNTDTARLPDAGHLDERDRRDPQPNLTRILHGLPPLNDPPPPPNPPRHRADP